MWYNADSRENVTQRIVYDADGDGLYNGSEDWDSGEFTKTALLRLTTHRQIVKNHSRFGLMELGALASIIINQFHPMVMYKMGQ